MGGFAWVTLATNDSYSLGALVLAHSLRRVNTAHQLVVLITPGVTQAMRTQLSAVFNLVKLVDVLDSNDAANLSLLARPELGITFTKLHCWKLTQFDKCVFLDADTLVLQNSDELFEREELSAAPDAGWPDCFNSGVFVYKPNGDTFKALIDFAMIHGSFDGGDQGLLNLFFNEWPTKDIKKHLPFVYNMCSTATYSYLPAFKQFGHGLKIVHFIGTAKPWLQPFNTETGLASVSGESQHVVQFVQLWWDLFCTHVHSSLSTDMARARLSSSYDFSSVPPLTPSEVKQNYHDPRPSAHSPSIEEHNHPQSYYNPWDDDDLLNGTFDKSGKNLPHYDEQDNRQVSPEESTRQSLTSSDPCGNQHHHVNDSNHRRTQDSSSDHPDSAVSVENVEYGDRSSNSFSSRQDRFSNIGHTSRRDSLSTLVHNVINAENHALGSESPLRTISLPHLECSPAIGTATNETEQKSQTDQPKDDTTKSDAGLAAALSTVTLGSPLSKEHSALQEHLRRQGWEQGNIDYMGKDSFANIWQKICQTLSSGPQSQAPAFSETSASVAPIAAPVYFSSVEISPTGPIDTSPPASYAPVSPPKPVADSEPKAAKAAAEPATEKSASVTEIVPLESAPPTALDTPAQPSTEKGPDPVPTTTPAPAPAPTQEISSTTSAPIATPPETIPPPVLPTTPVSAAPAPDILTGGTAIPLGQTPLVSETPVPPTQTQPPSPAPATVDTQLPAPIPSAVPAPSPAVASEPPVPVVTSASEILTPQAPIETPVPSPPVPTLTEAPVCAVPLPETVPISPAPATEPVPPTPVAPLPTPPQSPLSVPVESATPCLPEPLIATPPPSVTLPKDEALAVQPAQPASPSVTEPTPPTSPLVAPQEPSLAKLQIDTEIPATPPAGASAADPSEPPVPPKRKGGSKGVQEAKAPKGKPAKGKK